MPDLPVTEPEPESRARRKPSSITCEFCECTLTLDGEIIKRGAKARAMMDLEDAHVKLTEKTAALEARIAALTAPPVEPPAARPKHWLDLE